VPATVIEAGPCKVVQVKTEEKDGYQAIQLGFLECKEKASNKPLIGHFKRVKAAPHRILKEFRGEHAEAKEGDTVTVGMFTEGEIVKVTGLTKGRGFAGVMKRHGFSGGPKSHGQSDRLRSPGSIGQSAYPKRVFKGIKMAGHMGQEKKTVLNLEVLKVIPEQNLLMLKGSVPGARNAILKIQR
jgi:large subunit ribosomal protein L3